MELFEKFRIRIGGAILRKKLATTKRKKHLFNIHEAKNICIVWDASRKDDFTSLSKFYQKMHENGKDVKIIGYFSGKSLPDQFTAIRYLSIIKRKELDLFYNPASSEIDLIIKKRFDILIDLNFNKLQPLKFFTALSNAGLKVGLFESENLSSPFDLMIELTSPVNSEQYLDQVIHYLGMINTSTERKFE